MGPIVDTTMIGFQTRPELKTQQLAAARVDSAKQMQKFREVAEDFEAVFISEMLRPMFENIEAEAPFGGGQSEDIWRNMQIDEYGKAIARSGGIGIADQVMEQMIRMQEAR